MSRSRVSRRAANKVKKEERITVVIGNPPYKEKAEGRGGWIEEGTRRQAGRAARPLEAAAGMGRRRSCQASQESLRLFLALGDMEGLWLRKLRSDRQSRQGRGRHRLLHHGCRLSQRSRLREDARRSAPRRAPKSGWSIARRKGISRRSRHGFSRRCSNRSASCSPRASSARIRMSRRGVQFRACRKAGARRNSQALAKLVTRVQRIGWNAHLAGATRSCRLRPARGRHFRRSKDLFRLRRLGRDAGPHLDHCAGYRSRLNTRWRTLVAEKRIRRKRSCFFIRIEGARQDRSQISRRGISWARIPCRSCRGRQEAAIAPTRYGFRSFDRQWIIPDARLINRPNPTLWKAYSARQVYLTAPEDRTQRLAPL